MFLQIAADISHTFLAWKENGAVNTHQIYQAVLKKDYEKLKILLKLANFDVINNKNWRVSPLDLAASQGDEISVKLLLEHEAIPDYNRPFHVWPYSTLSRAISSENNKVIEMLVNNGCDPDTFLSRVSSQHSLVTSNPDNYWYLIIGLDNISIFETVLKSKDRKIGNDKRSENLMLLACAVGSSLIVEYLLDQGVSIESKDDNGWTCIFYTVAFSCLTTFELLLARGANLNHKDLRGCNLFHIVALYYIASLEEEELEIIELLIDNNVDINATDSIGLTPINTTFTFIWSSVVPDIINYFLSLGQSKIDYFKPDNDGVTILHRAVRKRFKKKLIKILLLPGVDINVRDKFGRTPMHFINTSCPSNIGVLLEFGADTKVLHCLEKSLIEDETFLIVLQRYKIMRELAELDNDPYVDSILDKYRIFLKKDFEPLKSLCSDEIEWMKDNILCDKLTYYNFLHAKRRLCIKVAKMPDMCNILFSDKHKHRLRKYMNVLIKNYLSGLQPLTPIESEAINFAETNLDIIFNNKLPSLVVYKIKKYIDIEDMVTLKNMKLFE